MAPPEDDIVRSRTELLERVQSLLHDHADASAALDPRELRARAEQLGSMTAPDLLAFAEQLGTDAETHEIAGNQGRAEVFWELCADVEELARRTGTPG